MQKNDEVILKAVSEKNGEVNWYQLGRKRFPEFDHSENFGTSLERLKAAGLIQEVAVDGEPLPRLALTESGEQAVTRLRS